MHNSISFIFWCLTLPTTNFKLNRKTAKNNQKTEYCTGDLFESDPVCNYNMDIAAKLTSGVDVWLNTPLPPMEASGTSGMKAAHNGVINFSVLDGLWMEGCIEGVTGWAIGPHPRELLTENERRDAELQDLYSKLEYLIVPTFYTQKDAWINLMKNSIAKIAYYFQTQWVMRRYITEAYLI